MVRYYLRVIDRGRFSVSIIIIVPIRSAFIRTFSGKYVIYRKDEQKTYKAYAINQTSALL